MEVQFTVGMSLLRRFAIPNVVNVRNSSRWLVCLSMAFQLTSLSSFAQRTILVGEGFGFSQLEKALETARPYDTIRVVGGNHLISQLEIKIPCVLEGVDGVILEGHGDHELFVVRSDSVTIRGFHLRNVEVSYLKDRAAIRLIDVEHVLIENNYLENTFFGIYLQKSDHCSVLNNRIIGTASQEYSSGNAIHVWKATGVAIHGNSITGHRDGIYFEFVDSSTILDNNCYSNIRYGLHFMFSDNDLYERNTFRDNGVGVAVMFSKKITMRENVFSDNWGGTSYGILLKEISDGTLEKNTFRNNTTGIYMEGTNRLSIARNVFSNNGWAIDMKGNCQDNKIRENNFIANTFEVVSNSRESNHDISANYWSHYRGYDLDHDGKGDLPHFPVSIFALLVEQIPASSLFLHSFLQYSLEAAEKVFPSITPMKLVDEYPLMKPYGYDYAH